MKRYHLSTAERRAVIEVDSSELMREYGPRFDRTARVISLQFAGREYLDGRGLVDEIGLKGIGVLGYDHAAPGGGFLKIGVGELVRNDAEPYRFSHRYAVRRLFLVEAELKNPSELVVRQEGWLGKEFGYCWEKSYRLERDGRLTLATTLTNLGTASWEFEHYNHNFFSFDSAPVDSDYRVELGFEPPLEAVVGGRWQITGRRLCLREAAPLECGVWWGGALDGVTRESNRLAVSHEHGGRVEVVGDFTPSRFALWAVRAALCPEIFWRATIASGACVHAQRTYVLS